MPTETNRTGLQLRSTLKAEGVLELTLAQVPVAPPAADEVLVRMEAAPINPSDQGVLFAGADMTRAEQAGTAENPTIHAPVAAAVMAAMAGRVGQALPAGNEGAGIVIEAGSDPAAQALLGKTVAVYGGAMYAEFRTMKASQCLLLPAGTTPAEGASCFVNPLTVLGMVETMRMEGHKAIVHTAAASNLGQMLNRLCIKDGIGLVNVVRRPEHVELLRKAGATYVCDSSAPTFIADLTDAIEATGATIGFDATGGGRLAGQVLAAMESALTRSATEFSRYGSTVHKQVYIYGGLDRNPTEFTRAFGMSWGLGGWLLGPFLQKIGAAEAQRLRERVASEVKTTFASSYTKEITLRDVLRLEEIAVYGKQATGAKYLVNPAKK